MTARRPEPSGVIAEEKKQGREPPMAEFPAFVSGCHFFRNCFLSIFPTAVRGNSVLTSTFLGIS